MKNKPTKRGALVFYGKKLAGHLCEQSNEMGESFEFQYDPAYLQNPMAMPISLALPLRPEKYQSKKLFPFFEGLLPEGWLLELTSQTLKINPDDSFELLLHTGSDTVGAVTVWPEE